MILFIFTWTILVELIKKDHDWSVKPQNETEFLIDAAYFLVLGKLFKKQNHLQSLQRFF